jgi:glutamyl-tRNA synthetase
LGIRCPGMRTLPYVAEPGSKNKLSKRKIAQYLKNADFKKLYDHGHCESDSQRRWELPKIMGL